MVTMATISKWMVMMVYYCFNHNNQYPPPIFKIPVFLIHDLGPHTQKSNGWVHLGYTKKWAPLSVGSSMDPTGTMYFDGP